MEMLRKEEVARARLRKKELQEMRMRFDEEEIGRLDREMEMLRRGMLKQLADEKSLEEDEVNSRMRWRKTEYDKLGDMGVSSDMDLSDQYLVPLGARQEELRDLHQQLPNSTGGMVCRKSLIHVLSDKEVRGLLMSSSRFHGANIALQTLAYTQAMDALRSNEEFCSWEELCLILGPATEERVR